MWHVLETRVVGRQSVLAKGKHESLENIGRGSSFRIVKNHFATFHENELHQRVSYGEYGVHCKGNVRPGFNSL